MTLRLLLATTVSGALLSPTALHAQKPFTVLTQWKVGGQGGWDYLLADPGQHRLYITHNTRVEVLDSSTGKSTGSITGLGGTHGIALDPKGKFGFISDGGANQVVVFDRSTLAKVDSIPAGTNPDGIVFEPLTRTVWAFNGRSKNASVIDADTHKVLATLDLPGKPEFPTADGKGTLFVNIEDKNEILRLDAKSKTVTATWPLAGCDSPSGMAIDPAGRRLFSVCDGKKMVVVSADTGKTLATPAIGEGPDAAGYDAKDNLAFSSNGDGTLTIIDASKPGYPVLQTVPTKRGARTMAFDSANRHVYLVTADMGPRPAATPQNPRPRPAIVPDTFTVLVVGRD
jgi:DNA-binding beta-propeller fold protein YncE